MVLATGSRLTHYEIVRPIGSGGMGVVYRARDLRHGRDVALKIMAPHIAADPAMRARVEAEARAAASLTHPAIMAIHELAVVEGMPIVVMELLEGSTLNERLQAGALPWREAARIAGAIAGGLAAAHDRGIVHRDLQPENVFLTTGGGVKILDFGLALRVDAGGPTQGHVVGTFGYTSPEQVSGGPVDGRADIFALGCLLYEMVAGDPLFAGATAQEVIGRLLHGPAPDLTGLGAVAPQAFRDVVSGCVEREPANRFATAHDLVAALRRLQGIE